MSETAGSGKSDGAHVVLIFGRQRHKVPVTSDVTEFQASVQKATGVLPENQVLLIGGKTIRADEDFGDMLSGLKSGTRAMLSDKSAGKAQKKPTAATPLDKVRKMDSQLNDFARRNESLREELETKLLGFLDDQKTKEALDRLLLQVKRVEEDCMRVLENLDAVSPADAGTLLNSSMVEQLRAERKACVLHAQRVLRQCDKMKDDIALHKKDEFEEIASRRGHS